MDEQIKSLLEITKDLLEILVLILTARQLKGKKKRRSTSRREQTPAPSWGFYYTTSTKKMKVKTLRILLVALVILNILDGDFANPSVLDWIKFVLLTVCLILSFRKEKS